MHGLNDLRARRIMEGYTSHFRRQHMHSRARSVTSISKFLSVAVHLLRGGLHCHDAPEEYRENWYEDAPGMSPRPPRAPRSTIVRHHCVWGVL